MRAGEDHGEGQEGPQLDALGQRARDDRGGGGAEHQLEEEVRADRGVGDVDVRRADADRLERRPVPKAPSTLWIDQPSPRVHQVVADQVVHDRGDREEADVLGELHGHVLRPHEAGFEHREARGHPEHQEAADQEQKRGEDEADLGAGGGAGGHRRILRDGRASGSERRGAPRGGGVS